MRKNISSGEETTPQRIKQLHPISTGTRENEANQGIQFQLMGPNIKRKATWVTNDNQPATDSPPTGVNQENCNLLRGASLHSARIKPCNDSNGSTKPMQKGPGLRCAATLLFPYQTPAASQKLSVRLWARLRSAYARQAAPAAWHVASQCLSPRALTTAISNAKAGWL